MDPGNCARVEINDGKYVLFLTGRQNSMTFIRSTLERFQKLNDTFVVKTDAGSCAFSLTEILNFDEEAINFRFTFTGEATEVYADNVLAKAIGVAEFV